MFDHVFHLVNVTNLKAQEDKFKGLVKVLIRCSFVEIYNEEIRDLLCKFPFLSPSRNPFFKGELTLVIASEIVKRKLEIKELGQAGVQVQGCTIKICKSVQDMV